ncbi:Phosphomannomutase [Halalkaliarchaeum sp. AArc-CO]|uniref:phosphoglucosamine mutase n=1 Tax=unclassified Halalkaliarchaeum TaxID=2678344 RepID=UPI00217D6E32|nr:MULTISPECIES: phosphoglucosamine mutase [unclassified Halalkaliarchaeum]MDR5673398.1 phosphoglucosamine mutase [Halalkaliarchaeum sp. AArc-GB]UWG49739.1 Phosphomannomutase [Halalkaliarchaeum sp. AArc-CO]
MFGTSGIRGAVGSEVTAALAVSLGRAIGSERRPDGDAIETAVIGRDPRESGRVLSDALSAGLRETGADVVRIGEASTPTIARGVAVHDADVGIAVTASHNPPSDNGFKLWNPDGGAYRPKQRRRIERRIREESFELVGANGLGEETDSTAAIETHRQALVDHGRENASDEALAELSVVLDLGNGAGRVTADALAELGVGVETLNAQPDGRFPGRPSEPTAETCDTLAATVEAIGADLGLAHDGDADRLLAVDETGRFVPGDELLALFATRAAGPGERVAVPVDTSQLVADALGDLGADVEYTEVGDVHVAEATRTEDVVFGGEPSGAWIRPDRTRCPDGPLAAVALAAIVAEDVAAGSEGLSSLLSAFEPYPIVRDQVETDRKRELMDVATDLARDRFGPESDGETELTTIDGIRVDAEDGWFLVRASGTQPLVRITAEATTTDRRDELARIARELLSDATDQLDDQSTPEP